MLAASRIGEGFHAGQVEMRTLSERLVGSLVFPLWARRDHPLYDTYMREFERSQFLAPHEIKTLQIERLRMLLKHAHDQCPFYRHRMNDVGLCADRLTSLDQLSTLPITMKRDIQDRGREMQARNFPESRREQNQTGGSTGSPLQFLVDKDRFDSRMASTVRHNNWAGYQPGDWCAELWGARLDQVTQKGLWDWCRNALLYRLVELNTSTIRPDDWDRFIAAIRKKGPRVMVAYTQSAVLFARYLRGRGIDDIRFESVITTAEVLLPGQREYMEETFRGRVFNRYGCREVSVIASECSEHCGMHVNADALLVEIVPDPLLAPPYGRVVITDLLNLSMPLIRYEIGDVGRWAENQDCPCGRGLPLLEDLQGRITDFLVLRDGRRVSGPSLTLVVADIPEVRQVQFVQKSLDRVTLRVVPGNGYGSNTAAELQRRLLLYLDGLACMEIEEVKSIPSLASGKYRFVVNEFDFQAVGASDTSQGART
jgi:phenylacetate-coenzyme A ligase PaaK-like adenylate-forming protein